MGEGNHGVGLGRPEASSTVQFPEAKPVLKMFGLEVERNVCARKSTIVPRRTSGLQRPEFPNSIQVRRPIVDPLIKDWADDVVLTDVGIKRTEQGVDSGPTAQAIE